MIKCSKPLSRRTRLARDLFVSAIRLTSPRFVGLDVDNMNSVLHTRAIELAALAGKDVKVSWNGETIATNSFEKFVKLFVKDEASLAYERCV
jgi:hypothetical protein